MKRAKAARRDQREGSSGLRIRVRLRSASDVLWNLGETLNRGWLLAPWGFSARIGAPVEVEFGLPEPAPVVFTHGKVIALIPGAMPNQQRALVRFARLTPPAKEAIDKLVYSYRNTYLPSDLLRTGTHL